MKKEYVSLNLKIVDVKLSDCIAGSSIITKGSTSFHEIDASNYSTGDGTVTFSSWGNK